MRDFKADRVSFKTADGLYQIQNSVCFLGNKERARPPARQKKRDRWESLSKHGYSQSPLRGKFQSMLRRQPKLGIARVL